ncbi:hypothetical protein C8Q70DRAFT_439560 [Cubamyces menziesii]|nr:hypothetical protein C8Q70DRAFT_439560 [Cubamyces menziesii]
MSCCVNASESSRSQPTHRLRIITATRTINTHRLIIHPISMSLLLMADTQPGFIPGAELLRISLLPMRRLRLYFCQSDMCCELVEARWGRRSVPLPPCLTVIIEVHFGLSSEIVSKFALRINPQCSFVGSTDGLTFANQGQRAYEFLAGPGDRGDARCQLLALYDSGRAQLAVLSATPPAVSRRSLPSMLCALSGCPGFDSSQDRLPEDHRGCAGGRIGNARCRRTQCIMPIFDARRVTSTSVNARNWMWMCASYSRS